MHRWLGVYVSMCALLLVSTPTPSAAQNAGMGATFDAVAATATEITTTFRDARATTVKHADGRLETTLYDADGQRLLQLLRHPRAAWVEVNAADSAWRHRVGLSQDTSYSPDWGNAQAWRLWHDTKKSGTSLATATAPPLVLDGKFLRVRGARDAEKRSGKPIDIEDEIQSVQAVFPQYVGLATRRRTPGPRPDGVYATFTARLQTRSGETLGFIRVFAKERIVSWTFNTGERGVATESRVPGGFKFRPNMAWAIVQAIWFHEHPPRKPLPIAANGVSSCAAGIAPAKPPSTAAPRAARVSFKDRLRSWVGGLRFLPSVAPTGSVPRPTTLRSTVRKLMLPLTAPAAMAAATAEQTPCDGQSDGCTGLHWLDGSIFRQCCDRHDVCYEKDCPDSPACKWWSWIAVWDRWECTLCNIQAVLCFVTGGGGGGSGSGGPISPNNDCWSDTDCPDGYTCEWDGTCKSWF